MTSMREGGDAFDAHRVEPVAPHAPISRQRWERIVPLLDAALELEVPRRPAFLADVCGEDDALRAELEQMIAECSPKERSDVSRGDLLLGGSAQDRFAALLDDDVESLPPMFASRFRVTRVLGRGGMATVYLARDAKHGRDVALKVLRQDVGAFLGTARFISEIRVTANLQHPNILALFDSGEEAGRLYYVMPYAEGGSLRDWMNSKARPSTAVALQLTAQIAGALAAAHAHGIVHRDIKPENVLLTRDRDHAYLADFGIALAARDVDGARDTAPGLVVGTPRYMSPEQRRGEPHLDGRSDVYSLACVLYELLTGITPSHVFADDDGRLSTVSRLRGPLENVVSSQISDILIRALAVAPEDRVQDAAELARVLEQNTSPERTISAVVAKATTAHPAASGARHMPKRVGIGVGVGLAVMLAVGLFAKPGVSRFVETASPDANVDADVIAILPFRESHTSTTTPLDGESTARLLAESLSRWQTLRFSDDMRVSDAYRRAGRGDLTVDGAQKLAHNLGAGQFVWGEVGPQNGGVRISAALYDSRGRAAAKHIAYVTNGSDVLAAFNALADSLVAKVVGTPAASAGAAGTRHFGALKHYTDGYAALHSWNTELAEQHFRAATTLDPSFAQATLALAQAMAWSGRHAIGAWREAASRAVDLRAALSPRDQTLSRALLALSEGRMPDACAEYRSLLARDTRDFAAHFGLGDCLSRDRRVLSDSTSPTGWRFRASMQSAIAEYREALQLVPSYLDGSRGQAFGRLSSRILHSGLWSFRSGVALTPDTVRMGAFPELKGDTLVYYPVPEAMLGPEPATHREAVARAQQWLREFAARAVSAFPTSATAHTQYSEALEVTGALDGRTPSALSEILAARVLPEDDGESRVRRASAHARILIKLGRYSAAAAVADSILAARTEPSPREAVVLASLAALTGRARLAAGLLSRAAADSGAALFAEIFLRDDRLGRPIPSTVLASAAAFAGYAALGAPADSVRGLYARTDRAIQTWVRADERERVRAFMLLPAGVTAQPVLGGAAIKTLTYERDPHLIPWQKIADGDMVGARRLLANADARGWKGVIPEPDVSLRRALLAIALHDTAQAVAALDSLAAAIPSLSSRLTTEVPPAAALARAMLLRATLKRDSMPVAAAALWAHADADVRAAATARVP